MDDFTDYWADVDERVSRVALERAQIAMRRQLADIPGVKITPSIHLEEEYGRAVLEIRASVLAAKRVEGPYTLSDRVTQTVCVPERPVRDGVLDWLSRHGPRPLSSWCSRWRRLRSIPLQHVVMQQEIHYYGCPHTVIESDRDGVHLEWMARESGQSG